MLLLYHSHKHISYPIRTIARSAIICNIIGYVWGIGGPLMTVVIIGAALLAIFGRMPWPALFALGIFCAV
ncbi:TrbC/VirB2 family protein [Wolbachia pipientis]|nr:TrbC/VirB2 family protein [Wolbachia pipientis]